MKPIGWYICAMPRNDKSAGQKALHVLCDQLRRIGEDAYVSVHPTYPRLDAPYAPDSRIGPETIVVMPDFVRDPPRRARRIVRWVLGYPGHYGGPTSYPKDDLVVAYQPNLARAAEASAGLSRVPVVHVATVEPWLFFDDGNRKRRYDVAYTGKGVATASVPKGTIQITTPWPATRAATAKLLRGARRCYLYDGLSAVGVEAHACGCEVRQLVRGEWVTAPPLGLDVAGAWADVSDVVKLRDLADIKWPRRVLRCGS